MSTFADRMKQAMRIRGMNQVAVHKATKIDKSLLSCYASGKYKPKQTNLHEISLALNVSEAWLMGFDVPMEREPFDKTKELNEKILFLLDKLSPEQKMLLIAQMKGIIAAAEEKK